MNEIRAIVVGAAGRMGKMLVRAIAEAEDFRLVGATERPGSALLGKDAGEVAGVGTLGVELKAELAQCPDADVVIDFTTPKATLRHAEIAQQRGMRLVVGTTGFSREERKHLEAIAHETGAVIAANFSIGVNLCLALVEQAARALGDGFDLEIVEAHHRRKVDAPSGTALALAEAAARAKGVLLDQVAVFAREGIVGERKQGTIGFAVVRGGGVIGEHRVLFLGEKEVVEIRHEALDRAVFAAGALHAARWLVRQPLGLYSMREVLGLN